MYVCTLPSLGREREIWEQTVDIWEQVLRECSNGMYIGRQAAGYTYHTRVLYIDVDVQEEEEEEGGGEDEGLAMMN